MKNDDAGLSDQALAYRDSLLPQLRNKVATHRTRKKRRRRLVQVVVAAGGFVLLGAWLGIRSNSRLVDMASEHTPQGDIQSIGNSIDSDIEVIRKYVVNTDSGILDRYVIHSDDLSEPKLDVIEDSELLATFPEADSNGFVAMVEDSAVYISYSDDENLH